MHRALLVLAWLPLLAGCSRRPPPRPAAGAIARLTSMSGEVGHRRAAALAWDDARPGLELFAADAVKTGRRATARVEYLAGGQLDLDEQSLVVIEAPADSPASGSPTAGAAEPPAGAPVPVARLQQGTLRGVSRPGGAVQVLLPDGRTARIAAEGQEAVPFRVRVREGGKVEVAVLKGAAQVSLAGSAVRVNARHAVEIGRGAGLGAAQPLPAFPELLAPAADAKYHAGTTVPLRWQPVPGASLYRAQVSESLAFDRCLVDETVTVPKLDLSRPAVGKTYVWRVSSVDSGGRESEFGFARRFFVLTAPPPPAAELLTPPDNAGVQYVGTTPRPLVFRWRGGAPEYELVISRRIKLDGAVVQRKRTKETSLTLPGLSSGFYYWGVYALTSEGRRPIFAQARRLVVARRLPPGVKVPNSIDWK